MLSGKVGNTVLFVWMFSILVNGAEEGAGVGQVNCAVVNYGYKGVGHFAHSMYYVNAGVAA